MHTEQMLRSVGDSRSPHTTHRRGEMKSSILVHQFIVNIQTLPVVTKALRRKHFVKSQTRLSRHERQENVEDMFELRDSSLLQGKHVLLIDDICTTGATLTACVDVLKNILGIRLSILTLGFTKT